MPEATATLLKRYAEFLDSTQEYVVVQALRLAFRRDKEFHAWLATHYPETRVTSATRRATGDASRPTPAPAAARAHAPSLPDPRADRARS